MLVEASKGLTSRTPSAQEALDPAERQGTDPHFWLDPANAILYVENIKTALSQADPAGAATYQKNADAYIAQLKDLDGWIRTEVQQLPPDKRLLVTNHENLGYYADRYGFRILGTVIPNTNPDAAPSAKDLAALIDRIKSAGVKAVFLDVGSNTQLADQVAKETGIRVVSDLYIETVSKPGDPAPTYIEMMKYDTTSIVEALK